MKEGPACCSVTRVEMGGLRPKGLILLGTHLSGLLVLTIFQPVQVVKQLEYSKGSRSHSGQVFKLVIILL